MNQVGQSIRTLSVICGQWSAFAVGRPADVPLAVMRANRVVSNNSAALRHGVSPGLRRREAQARCPSIELHDHDEQRDARVFEQALHALEDLVPRIEVVESGHCLFPSRGPSRYHGGDRRLAAMVKAAVDKALADDPGLCPVGIGIADGPRTASIAARESLDLNAPVLVPKGASAAFLAPLPVERLDHILDEDLIDLLRRLGLRTIGRFASLPPADVSARFGAVAIRAHRLANGSDTEPPILSDVAVDLKVSASLDPPADRVDRAAFMAKVLADDLHTQLSSRGLACSRILVVAETETGDRIERFWRHSGTFSSAAVAQRVRWQLEGWLGLGKSQSRCEGGVSRLEIIPDQVCPDDGVQLGFWGGTSQEGERAAKGLARIQALLGADSVLVPEHQGGRAPSEQYRLVPIDTVDLSARVQPASRPWPGRVPSPMPAVVWPKVMPAQVIDDQGNQVGVGGRGMISASPHSCALDGGPWLSVRAWAGPWCVDERWWDPIAHRRRARIQVVLGSPDGASHPSRGLAHILTLEAGIWWVEATYD